MVPRISTTTYAGTPVEANSHPSQILSHQNRTWIASRCLIALHELSAYHKHALQDAPPQRSRHNEAMHLGDMKVR